MTLQTLRAINGNEFQAGSVKFEALGLYTSDFTLPTGFLYATRLLAVSTAEAASGA
jgi:hypothetical protein